MLTRSQKIRQHEQDMQDLRDIRYAMELRDDEHKSDILLEFQGLVDEIKNKVRIYICMYIYLSFVDLP